MILAENRVPEQLNLMRRDSVHRTPFPFIGRLKVGDGPHEMHTPYFAGFDLCTHRRQRNPDFILPDTAVPQNFHFRVRGERLIE